MSKERFKKPTEEELILIAMAMGIPEDARKLAEILSFSLIVLDRLYDNGDINTPSEKEKRYYAGESVKELFPDNNK